MLSYQHSYHVGGPADVHKHFMLAQLLTAMTRKDRGITYIESHAGRGVYDLESAEARKTGEWRAGLGALNRDVSPDEPYWHALDHIRSAFGPNACPGSPAVAAALLRPQDRVLLMELHPAEHSALKLALKGRQYRPEPKIEIHNRDGAEGTLSMSPPTPRRGLVLIDPSYEQKSEYLGTAEFALALHAKWPEATIMVWYPILAAGRHKTLKSEIKQRGVGHAVHKVAFPPHGGRETGMTGSGLLLINPPFGHPQLNWDRLTSLGVELS